MNVAAFVVFVLVTAVVLCAAHDNSKRRRHV